jgi:hypothetical protein
MAPNPNLAVLKDLFRLTIVPSSISDSSPLVSADSITNLIALNAGMKMTTIGLSALLLSEVGTAIRDSMGTLSQINSLKIRNLSLAKLPK